MTRSRDLARLTPPVQHVVMRINSSILVASSILAGFIILSWTLATVWRYDTTGVDGGGVRIVDRWTNEVSICGAGRCFRVYSPAK